MLIFFQIMAIFSLINITAYINTSLILFFLGLWGIFVMRHNLIILLMNIEMLLLSITLMFVSMSVLFR